MARYKPYNPNQSRLVPITLSEHLYEGSLEEAIHKVVEEQIDLSRLDQLYINDDTGRPAIHPKVLLKVILLAYARGISGSRPIERACRENVLFMALAGGEQPDHSTIAAFIVALKGHILDLFVNGLLICDAMKLLDGTHLSLDGLKLPSNASKEHSGTFKDLKKKRSKLKGRLKELIREHRQLDKSGLSALQISEDKHKKQIKRLRNEVRRIDRFLAKEEPKEGKTQKEIKSNITDNDSAKMPTSHGVIQGYNAQAMVDDKHQIIVHAEAMGNGQDSDNLEPMLKGTKENLKAIGKGDDALKGKILTADSNYHSNKNIEKCEEEQLDAYIPDINFRKRDDRFKDQDRYKDGLNKPPKPNQTKRIKTELEDFTYDKENDCYVCPEGHALKLEVKQHVLKSGNYRTYRMKDDYCVNCKLRTQCVGNKKARRRYLCVPLENPPTELNPSQRMRIKIDSPLGKIIYGLRLGNVEPVFGNLRSNKKLDRFTYRGKDKVNVQWLLFCLVHNIEKIAHYGMA
ncbi:MAG: IS1182 family transposase [Calditrichaceae bacterium]